MRIIKVRARRAFNPSKIPGAKWSINQYVGCQHSCMYCYAKFMCRRYNYGEWGSWVVVKENIPNLVRGKYVSGYVYMSTVSDAYQPIESRFNLTRRILENMNKRIKLSVLTKSDLILRDIDLLKKFKSIEVGLTLNSFPSRIRREIEPGAPKVKDRINALKKLKRSGIRTYSFISPIIPELTDIPKIVEETREFSDFHYFEFLNVKASGPKFMRWIRENFPETYKILTDKDKFEKYVSDMISAVKQTGINVGGIVLHPRLKVVT